MRYSTLGNNMPTRTICLINYVDTIIKAKTTCDEICSVKQKLHLSQLYDEPRNNVGNYTYVQNLHCHYNGLEGPGLT